MPEYLLPPIKTSGRLARLSRSFRHRNYRLFFFGQGISLVGTWMQNVALSWLIYLLNGSSLELGLLGFYAQFPVFLFSLLGGVLADRLNRHRLLMITQTASLIQATVLAGLTLSSQIAAWHLYILASLLGLINAVDIPVRQSFMSELVDKKDLHNAIGLNSSMFNAASVIGPSVAGILVAAIGEGWCFLVNAISFLALIAGLLAMRLKPSVPFKAQVSILTHLKEGWRFAWNTPSIRATLLLLGTGGLLGGSYMVLMPIFAVDILNVGARGLGLLLSAAGLGSLAGALTLAARRESSGLPRLILGAALGFGVCLLLFPLSRTFYLSALILVPTGYCMIFFMAGTNTLLQLHVPDELRGRIMSFFSMMIMGMAPFGALLSGILTHWVGAPLTVGLCGGAILAMATISGKKILLNDA